jgi:hypothetical protein
MGASGRRRTTGQTQTLEASRRSGERAQRRVVIGFVLDLTDQLAVQHAVGFVEDDDGACRQPGER